MPGLKQLQQFNSDIMTLGDEAKIRAARGEKPVSVPIPKTVKDIDDSDEFINGLPMLSEEEQAQADAAAREREREANDFSEFIDSDDDKDSAEESPKASAKKEAAVPDMSDLLPTDGAMDFADLDLSDFEEASPEPEPEPEPKEVAIEDMDLDSLLAFSEQPKEEEPEEEESLFFDPNDRPQKTIDTPTVDVSDSLFGSSDEEPVEDLGATSFDTSLFDMPEEPVAETQDLPELDESSLADTLGGIGELNEDPEPMEDVPAVETENAVEEITDFDFSTDGIETPVDAVAEEAIDVPEFDTDAPADSFDFSTDEAPASDSFDAADFDFGTGDALTEDSAADAALGDEISSEEIPAVEMEVPAEEPQAAEPKYYEGELEDPNKDFATTESVSLNDDLPVEFNEISDLHNEEQQPEESMDMDLPDFGEDSSADMGTDEFSVDLPDVDENPTAEIAPATDDFAGLDSAPAEDFSTDGLDLPDFGDGSADVEIPSFEESTDNSIAPVESLSPEEAVPEDEFGSVETFDTSDINNLDFSNEENTDFALGSLDGAEGDDEFSIPGFSDTVTANLDRSPRVETPDFSGAAELDEKDKPKNTFTDAEYKRFLKNLATYPLNVRIALEDFVVKNEFTDDAIFAVLEKVLRKAPARQVATELEKLLDISLDVPRDFERRSAAEYEAYKKSIEYQLKNKIIPGAIMTAAAAILVFCIFTLTNNFIYKPLRASNLYKQGYALLQDSQYPQSEERFNQALSFKPVKKWFYTYAEGYRDHKQYDRSRMMYKAILRRYNHEKKAGLDWARMEWEDLYNYEESERILKREVLDYHINDSESILTLGDLYLDWATDSDDSKFPLAKQNYDLLVELYGSSNLYLSRQMRYFIRTDNLRQVLAYKEIFMGQKKGLVPADEIELSGYMLDKRFGKLRPSEEKLRSQIEDVRKLLERALKSAPQDPVALYNMGRYFVETKSGKNAARLLQAAIDTFETQTRRNKRDTYKYINSYRLLGEEMRNQREYLTAETLYGRGIDVYEHENASSRFESDENVGKLYADLADLDYFIAADNEAALMHYESAVNNKYDTSSVRYRIGYIQYQNQNYPAALGSFIKSQDTSGNDIHLLLALANTLSLSSDNYVARGYYERLISILDGERQKYGILFPQVREDQGDIVDTYMKASNNLGVTLSRIATNTGDSSLNGKAIVNLQESLRAWDALTRNQTTMIRLEGSNLAEQNVRYITHPMSDYEPEIYTEIPRVLFGEEGLE
ncbi:MAG: hypothetical protein KBS64_07625 [Treponema sp.]|nr:hypothetical protein [Candidatus Treponema equi]